MKENENIINQNQEDINEQIEELEQELAGYEANPNLNVNAGEGGDNPENEADANPDANIVNNNGIEIDMDIFNEAEGGQEEAKDTTYKFRPTDFTNNPFMPKGRDVYNFKKDSDSVYEEEFGGERMSEIKEDDELDEEEPETVDERTIDVPLHETGDVVVAINRARLAAENDVRKAHLAKKPEYDKAKKLKEEIESITATIVSSRMRAEELQSGPDKDNPVNLQNIESYLRQVQTLTDARMQISPESEVNAERVIAEYEAEESALPDSIKKAQDEAETDLRAKLKMKQAEDRFVKAENKRLRDYLYQKMEIRDAKKAVDQYEKADQEYYNGDLAIAVHDAENAPKEDLYKLINDDMFKGEDLDFTKLTEVQLLDIEQAFDRMFRGLNNLYYKHKLPENKGFGKDFLSNIYYNSKDEKNNAAKEKVEDKVVKLLQTQGLDIKDITSANVNRYIKAYIFQNMYKQTDSITFEPAVMKNGKLEQVTADDDMAINFGSIQGLLDDPSVVAGQKYDRIPFSRMKEQDPDISFVPKPVEVQEEMDPEYKAKKFQIDSLKQGLMGEAHGEELQIDQDFQAEGLEEAREPLARQEATDKAKDELKRLREKEEKKQKDRENSKRKEEIKNKLEAERAKGVENPEDNLTDEEKLIFETFTDISDMDYNEMIGQGFVQEPEANDDGFSTDGKLADIHGGGYPVIPEEIELAEERFKNNEGKFLEEEKQLMKDRLEPVKLNEAAAKLWDKHSFDASWNLEAIYGPIFNMIALSTTFKGYENELEELNDIVRANYAILLSKAKETAYIPGTDKVVHLISDPNDMAMMAKDIVRAREIISAINTTMARRANDVIAEKRLELDEKLSQEGIKKSDPEYNRRVSEWNLKNGSPEVIATSKLATIIHNQMRILESPYYGELSAKFSDDILRISASLEALPNNSFYVGEDKDKKPIYMPDDARYQRLMERVPFLDQIYESQSFIMSDVIPYLQNRDEGSLTENENDRFLKASSNHLNEQRKYFSTIHAVSDNDPDIKALKDFHGKKNGAFAGNWKKNTLGNAVYSRIDESVSVVDRGWPIDDVGFVKQLAVVAKVLETAANSKELDAARKAEAKEILGRLKKPMKNIREGYVTSPEMRDDILESIAGPIHEYVIWDKAVRGVNSDNTIEKLYTEAVNRKIYDFDICRAPLMKSSKKFTVPNPEYDRETNNNVPEYKVVDIEVPGGFSQQDIMNNLDIMVDDLHSVEVKMFGSGEFKVMKEYVENLRDKTREIKDIVNLNNDDLQAEYVKALSAFKGLAIKTLDKVRKYLEHKGVDFDRKQTRRDSDGKQGVEQSRINMAIGLFDKLSLMIDRIQAYEDDFNPEAVFIRDELPDLKREAASRFAQKLEKDEKKLETGETMEEYVTTVGNIVINYVLSENASTFDMHNKETVEQCRKRLQDIQPKNYTWKEIREIANNDRFLRNLLQTEINKFVGNTVPDPKKPGEQKEVADPKSKQLKPGAEKMSYHDIKMACIAEVKKRSNGYKKANINDRQLASKTRKEESKQFKDKLVSRQRKEAMANRAQAKKNKGKAKTEAKKQGAEAGKQ